MRGVVKYPNNCVFSMTYLETDEVINNCFFQ